MMHRAVSLVLTSAALAVVAAPAATQTWSIPGADPRGMAVVDTDGDGDNDVAVTDYSGDLVTILINDGRGDLSNASALLVGTGTPLGLTAIAAGDFDGDGQTNDLLGLGSLAAKGIVIINGTPQSPAVSEFTIPAFNPRAVAVGKLNGGPTDDAVIACEGTPLVPGELIAFVDGTATLLTAEAGTGQWVDVEVCDGNRDGIADVFALQKMPAGDEIVFLAGVGDGSFLPKTPVATTDNGSTSESMACFDFDNDGKVDIVCCDPLLFAAPANELMLVLDAGGPTPRTVRVTVPGTCAKFVVAADHDDNGMADVLVVNGFSDDVHVESDFDGIAQAFTSTAPLGVGTLPIHAVYGDFNGDLEGDWGVLNNGSNDLTVEIGGPRADATAYGTGCAGTAGQVPQVSATGTPVLGNSSFSIGLGNALGTTTGIIIVGGRPLATGLPGGCTLLTTIDYSSLQRTDANGQVTFPLPIPFDVELLRADLHFQWLVADPQGAFLNLASMSNAMKVTIGSR